MTANEKFLQRPETYLEKKKYENPKHIFKVTSQLLRRTFPNSQEIRILDAGCATGEFLYYLQTIFPEAYLAGIDNQNDFIVEAKKIPTLAKINFSVENVLSFDHQPYDAIVSIGVLPVFDECGPFLASLLQNTGKGGRIYIGAMFNDDDIDVKISYRDNKYSDKWQKGQNIFSVHTIGRFLRNKVSSYKFHKFELPFDLPRNPAYPHRGYTIKLENGKRQVVSGLCLMYHEKILEITV